MGVAISDWELARAVSEQGFLGVVSGTGISHLMIARLMKGDVGGHVRRALAQFPFQDPVKRILDKYFMPEGKSEDEVFKSPTMWTIEPPRSLNELVVIANFVEVFLAREGHDNPVGINLLEKVQLPNLASLYGAMLAGVAVVIMGAGIPMQIPGVLDRFADHKAASYKIDVVGADAEDDFRISFDPEAIFPGIADKVGPLARPLFLPIISSVVLAKALLKHATGRIDGFVIEAPIAGGHNAPPRGQLKLNEHGEPIYGDRDEVDLEKMKQLGLPFWLGGGYGSPEKFVEALDLGAAGIQVGTVFALSHESGMADWIKEALFEQVLNEDAAVRTSPVVSPTGYPFKVAQLEDTLSDPEIYASRPRICNQGFLRQAYKREDGTLGYRCPAGPSDQYVAQGGEIEDTEGRVCLCNNLLATAGVSILRQDGYREPPIVTIGDDLPGVVRLIKPGRAGYSAREVLDYLTSQAEKQGKVSH